MKVSTVATPDANQDQPGKPTLRPLDIVSRGWSWLFLLLLIIFFSLTGRFPQHKKIARWTFPLWLYVSITGIVTYVMLHLALSRG